ncbi:hypothetical protein DFH11DRAFT_1874602 [Phellopilus nigrolimitatus]|nr:hypothetical protein DFH11DRAFT_1874602 [Phellopilus nigrolimitatus]
MDYLVKIKNNVQEKQRYYQNDTRPLYWRPPRSRLYLNTWFTGLAVGLVGVGYGAVQLVKGLSPGLQRARAPYRVRNAITGLLIGTFAVGVWAYSIRAVKQDTLEDLDEEAKAFLDARMADEKVKAAAAAPTSTPSTETRLSSAALEKGELSSAAGASTLSSSTNAARPRGILASQLGRYFPRALDPASRTIIWGAPPVDRIGRLGDKDDRQL